MSQSTSTLATIGAQDGDAKRGGLTLDVAQDVTVDDINAQAGAVAKRLLSGNRDTYAQMVATLASVKADGESTKAALAERAKLRAGTRHLDALAVGSVLTATLAKAVAVGVMIEAGYTGKDCESTFGLTSGRISQLKVMGQTLVSVGLPEGITPGQFARGMTNISKSPELSQVVETIRSATPEAPIDPDTAREAVAHGIREAVAAKIKADSDALAAKLAAAEAAKAAAAKAVGASANTAPKAEQQSSTQEPDDGGLTSDVARFLSLATEVRALANVLERREDISKGQMRDIAKAVKLLTHVTGGKFATPSA